MRTMDPVSRIAVVARVKVQISAKQLPEQAVVNFNVTPDGLEEQLTPGRRDLATTTTGDLVSHAPSQTRIQCETLRRKDMLHSMNL
jgi:hypothetical protein